MTEKKLDGKVAVITGASKGLGKAMALALAAEGAQIALVSRNLEQLNEVGRAVKNAGGEARVFQADVAEEDQVRKLERDVTGALGKVHILINNAGINVRKPIIEFTLEEWHRVMNTNVTSVFLMCRSFIPHMKGTGYGRIISMTSIMSWVSLHGRAAYSASKTALLGLTRGHWGIENGLHGVRDGTLREDASRIRRGAATEVMAALRNIVIFLFKRLGHNNAAAATRHYVCHPEKSLKVLSTPN